MGEYFLQYDLTFWTISREFAGSFGWIIAMPPVLYGIDRARRRRRSERGVTCSWQSLPFLAWAVMATWRHAAFLELLGMSHGPPASAFFIIPYASSLALGALCGTHALVCIFDGQPSWTLGGALPRAVARTAVVTVVADGLFMASIIRSYLPPGGWSPSADGIPLY